MSIRSTNTSFFDFHEIPASVHTETNPFRQIAAPKIKEPPMFDGDPTKIANFIGHVKMYIYTNRSSFPDDTSKICFLCSYLSGYAFTWALPYLDNLGTSHIEICMLSFPLFLVEFQKSFGEVNERLNNETKLLRLRQGRSPASEYAITFRRLSAGSGFNDAALLCMFREGLSEDLKDELATRDLPDNLSSYVMKVIELDNRIRDRENRRRVGNRNPFNNNPRFRPTPQMAPSDNQSSNNTTTRRFAPLTPEEKDRRKKLGLCLYCGDQGHNAVNCPRKGKVITQGL